jgi:hypothetical protein
MTVSPYKQMELIVTLSVLNETMTNTTTVSSHNHQFARSHFGSVAGNSGSTNTGGSHTHSIVKPLYTKETMLRNQSGSQVSLGGALANATSNV